MAGSLAFLIGPLKKISVNLFFYFAKGARVDGALQWNGRMRSPRGHYPKPDAKPLPEGPNVWNRDDMMTVWELLTKAKLILKNNSKNYAYNLSLVNAKEIFSVVPNIPKLTSLAPNEELPIEVEFHQTVHEPTGPEADAHAGIPNVLKNRTLIIQYENEAGTKFFTHSFMDFKIIYNEYRTK
ncbi:MAG: hypothetical protein V4450_07380 [Bacteroidota bacterium]